MTQKQIESLNQQEYSHFLSYGEPERTDVFGDVSTNTYDLDALDEDQQQLEWISTLDSTTFPGMTFGYSVAP